MSSAVADHLRPSRGFPRGHNLHFCLSASRFRHMGKRQLKVKSVLSNVQYVKVNLILSSPRPKPLSVVQLLHMLLDFCQSKPGSVPLFSWLLGSARASGKVLASDVARSCHCLCLRLQRLAESPFQREGSIWSEDIVT